MQTIDYTASPYHLDPAAHHIVKYSLIRDPFNPKRVRIVVRAAQGSRGLIVGYLTYGAESIAFREAANALRTHNPRLTIQQRYDILKPIFNASKGTI